MSDKLFAPAQDVRRRSFCKKRDTVEGIEKRKMSNAKVQFVNFRNLKY